MGACIVKTRASYNPGMFSFIKKKLGWGSDDANKATAKDAPPAPEPQQPPAPAAAPVVPPPAAAVPAASPTAIVPPVTAPVASPVAPPRAAPAAWQPQPPAAPVPAPSPVAAPIPAALPAARTPSPAVPPSPAPAFWTSPAPAPVPEPAPAPVAERRGWLDKLRHGLRKTGSSIAQVFTGTQMDDALYEELEAALLMADAGVQATEHLLKDLKRRVKDSKASDPAQVKALLIDAITELLQPLEKSLE